MVDTNSNPNDIDFVIPSNDDATKSIDLIISNLCDAIKEGLGERKQNKEKVAQEKAAKEAKAAESAESAEKTTEEVKS
jgi:small subunit ribosomal protein S2